MDIRVLILLCCAVLWLNLAVWRARRGGWSKGLKLQVILALSAAAFAGGMWTGLVELAFGAAVVVAGLACLTFRYQRAPFGVPNTTRSRQ